MSAKPIKISLIISLIFCGLSQVVFSQDKDEEIKDGHVTVVRGTGAILTKNSIGI